jgi:DnaJ domain
MSGRQSQALTAAVDLLRIPSKVRAMRSSPLPPGMLLLLRLAAEDGAAQSDAEAINKRAPNDLRDAAIFFIEQILLASDSDAYRILGLDKTATNAELRRHMVYLLKWLHPDRHGDPHKARLARRVLLAWNELKSAKRSNGGSVSPEADRRERRIDGQTRGRPIVGTTQQHEPKERPSRYRKRLRQRLWPL